MLTHLSLVPWDPQTTAVCGIMVDLPHPLWGSQRLWGTHTCPQGSTRSQSANLQQLWAQTLFVFRSCPLYSHSARSQGSGDMPGWALRCTVSLTWLQRSPVFVTHPASCPPVACPLSHSGPRGLPCWQHLMQSHSHTWERPPPNLGLAKATDSLSDSWPSPSKPQRPPPVRNSEL